ENNGLVGIAAAGPEITVHLADVVVRGGKGDPNTGLFGEGVYAERGATITLARGRVEDNPRVGRYANPGAQLQLSESLVESTAGNSEGEGGYGLFARAGSTADVEHTQLYDNHVFGVDAEGEGTTIMLRDVEVMRTTRSSDGGLIAIEGTGLGATDGGYLSAD